MTKLGLFPKHAAPPFKLEGGTRSKHLPGVLDVPCVTGTLKKSGLDTPKLTLNAAQPMYMSLRHDRAACSIVVSSIGIATGPVGLALLLVCVFPDAGHPYVRSRYPKPFIPAGRITF